MKMPIENIKVKKSHQTISINYRKLADEPFLTRLLREILKRTRKNIERKVFYTKVDC